MVSALPVKSLFESDAQEAAPKTLRLICLRMKNFKGFKDLVLDLSGRSMNVFADNGLGKTTIEDSYLWLLTGKDSLNKQDFGLKPLKKGEPVHNVETEVEGVLSLDGRTIVLRRVFAEEWTKKRDQPKPELTGHKTTYFVDGVPKTQRQYEDFVSGLVDERVFRLLSDPRYFNEQLEWKERRKIVLDVCGDVTDADVIASNPDLSDLPEILGGRKLDDQLDVIKAAKTKVNKELEQIPVRISEVQRGLPDVTGLDADALSADLKALQDERQARSDELARAENGAAVADQQVRLAQISSRMTAIEGEYRSKGEKALYDLRSKLQEAKFAAQDAQSEVDRCTSDANSKQEQAAVLDRRIEELYNKYDEVDAGEFTHTNETVCPTCGQDLPEEMVEDARRKALEAFNLSKSEMLEAIRAEGKGVKQQKERLESDAIRARNEATLARKHLNEANSLASKLQADIDKAQAYSGSTNPVTDPEYRKLAAERDIIADAMAAIRAGGQVDTSGIRSEMAGLDERIALVQLTIAKLEQHRTGEARIRELEKQERDLSAEFERLEKGLFLCEEFMKTKVRMLDVKANSRFCVARFRMLEQLVNGAWVPCCETLGPDGVPYSKGLNNSAKINVGLDIIRTLSEHYGFRIPIFVDNAESITRLTPVATQVIRLVVSVDDKVLRFEKEAM